MVVVDIDHLILKSLLNGKLRKNKKLHPLLLDQNMFKASKNIMNACHNCEADGESCFEPNKNPALKREIISARKNEVPENYIQRIIHFAKQG